MRACGASALAAVLLCLSACDARPAGTREAPGPAPEGVAARLGLRGAELVAEPAPEDAVVERARRAVGDADLAPERARLFAAEDGDVRVALVPLGGPLTGGWLAAAVGRSGRVRSRAAWGCEELDAHAGEWRVFLDQFGHQHGLLHVAGPERGELASAADVDRWIADLERDASDEAELVRTAYRQKRLMRENGYRLERLRARDALPEAAWVDGWAADLDELVRLAPDLAPVLGGEETVRYRGAAREGARHLRALAASLRASDGDAARRAVERLEQRACDRCHDRIGELERERGLSWTLADVLETRELRTDLARVGVDVWALPGREQESQLVASALRAALALLAAGS